jgi:dTDP-4-dehydrorhamnose reductase
MKILIIGKNGQVGSSLVSNATTKHISYAATNRSELDITNQNAVESFFKSHHDFDFIINTAAYTQVDAAENDVDAARATNHLAVQYLAEAAKKYNIPLIHISTDYVFDGEKPTAYNEEDITNPKNVYGQTKLEGENVLKHTWKKHIILRVSWVFSEFGKNFVKTIAQLYDKKDTFSVVSDQTGSPTSARSIAQAIIAICKKLYKNPNAENYWGVYHYSDFPSSNWHQLASYVVIQKIKKTDSIKEVRPIEGKDYPTVAQRPKNSNLNTFKIKKNFGIEQKLWTTEVERIIKVL